MDLSLIDDRKFRSFKYEYESVSDVEDMGKELNLGSVYSRNPDLVIKMIEMSEYKGRELSSFVEGLATYNKELSSDKLFKLFDAYVSKVQEKGIEIFDYDLLLGDIISAVLGKVDSQDFKAAKEKLDIKHDEFD